MRTHVALIPPSAKFSFTRATLQRNCIISYFFRFPNIKSIISNPIQSLLLIFFINI